MKHIPHSEETQPPCAIIEQRMSIYYWLTLILPWLTLILLLLFTIIQRDLLIPNKDMAISQSTKCSSMVSIEGPCVIRHMYTCINRHNKLLTGTKDYAPKSSTFWTIASINPTEVQWWGVTDSPVPFK